MVFQDPLSSLHPMRRVGWQIVEAIRAHERVGKRAAKARAVELLRDVGLPSPEERIDAYPHELSGGMRQRVMIAMALALEPDLLIADEPTSALDVTVQAQILELLARLQDEHGMALLIVSHDLGVIAEQADEVAVMYAGRIVEQGLGELCIGSPMHPYTRGLLASIPHVDGPRTERLTPIPGAPPSPVALPSGCAFHPRCPLAHATCLEAVPDLVAVGSGHRIACPIVAGDVSLASAAS
jgi:oligopeptide/dipeptide ABC transporter ATP-binding protein